MLKRIGFWLAFCIAFGQGGILLADVVSRADARIAAANWTRDEAFSSERPNGSPSDVQTVMSDGREIVHVVSFGDGGWVVTSTDDRLEPVLAFSKSGSVETLLATPFVDILTADLRSRRIAEGLATTDDQEAGVAPAVKSADELLSTLPKVQTNKSSYTYLQEIVYDVVPVDPSASPVARAIDNDNLEFTTGGTSAWGVSTNTAAFGPSCVQSGKISRGASTWLETVVDGCGVLSFWWCCDTGYAIFGSDDVSFMIDGVVQSVIHGQTSWQELTYTLTKPGKHTLRWTYEKDALLSLFARSDCAWVDAISWTPVAPASSDPIIEEPSVPSTTVVSVSANPVDNSRGKVSGAKDTQVGRTVTLKATPNKGFAFGGWYVDRACTKPAVTVQATDFRTPTWGYTVTPADAESGAIQFWAKFVGPGEDLLELGNDFMPAEFVLDEQIELGIPVSASALSSTTIKVTGLPSGLKFTAKDIVDAKTKRVTVPANTIYGAPTVSSKKNAKTGELVPSKVVLTVTTSGKSTQRYTLAWTVEPLPDWAVGTFNGAALAEDGSVAGQSTVTVSTAGKISGKMLAQGKTWKISAASFSDESEEGTFHATITATCGKETLTDELTLRADELGGCLNGACLCAVQNNWKVEPWKSAAAKIAKKPKLTIPVDGVLTGEVVLSFGTAGTVKAAGCFVTGVDSKGRSQTVKVSCSSVLSPLTAANPETGSCVAETVIYFPAKGTFSGWVQRLVIEL